MKVTLAAVGRLDYEEQGWKEGGCVGGQGSVRICLGVLVPSYCFPLGEWQSSGEFVTLDFVPQG